jgi:hypothetical protein
MWIRPFQGFSNKRLKQEHPRTLQRFASSGRYPRNAPAIPWQEKQDFQSHLLVWLLLGHACVYVTDSRMWRVVAVGLGPFQLKWVGICHTELNANIEQHHILYHCIILHWNRVEVLVKDWFCKIITSWWSQSMEYWLRCVDMLRDRFTRQDDEASPMQCNAYSRVTKPT